MARAKPFLPGHNRRKATARYSEVDRGFKTRCWMWRGSGKPDRYGQICANGINLSAHRVMYILEKGEIPEGLVLDHLCRQRACVNPEHLEPVTQEENVFRMYVALSAEALAREFHAAGGVYTDIFALEGVSVRAIDAT